MMRASAAGIAVLVGAYASLAIAFHFEMAALVLILIWVAPAAAAFVVAYLTPHYKFTLGTAFAIPATAAAVAFNAVSQLLGHPVDFPGLAGARILAVVGILWSVVVCAAGAAVAIAVEQVAKGEA